MIEMSRDNIRIDPTLEVDTDWHPPCISAYVEMYFDIVDSLFGPDSVKHTSKQGLPVFKKLSRSCLRSSHWKHSVWANWTWQCMNCSTTTITDMDTTSKAQLTDF